MLSVPISSPLCLPSSQEYLLRVGFLADSPSVLSPGMTPGGLASVPTTGGRSVPSASPWPLASGSLPDELCPSLLLPSALPGRCHLCLASHLTPALTPPPPLAVHICSYGTLSTHTDFTFSVGSKCTW